MKNSKEKTKIPFLWNAPVDLKKKLELLSESQDISVSRLITEAVRAFCDKKRPIKL